MLLTEPVTLETVPALAENDQQPAPSRGQADIGLDPFGVLLWVGALLLLMAGVAALIIRRTRRETPAPAAAPEPDIPAEQWAHAALDALLNSNLLAEGRMKEFHVRLAEISKEYLGRRYPVHLMERTTAECPEVLRRAGVDASLAREVGHWLEQIDLVKFAGERPPSPQVVASVQALRNMVEKTTPRRAPEEIAAAAGQAGG